MSLLSSLATPSASTFAPAAPVMTTTATPGTITASSPVTTLAPGARYMANSYYSPYNTLYTQYSGARYALPSGTPANVAGRTTIPSTTLRPGTIPTAARRPAAPYRPYQPVSASAVASSGQQEQPAMGNLLMYSLMGGKKNKCSYRTAAQGKKSSSSNLLTLMMLSDTFADPEGGTNRKQMKSVFNYIDRRKHCKSGSDDLFDLLRLRGDIPDIGGGLGGLLGLGI